MIYKLIDSKTALTLMVGGKDVLAYHSTADQGYVYVYTRTYHLWERHEKSVNECKCSLLLSKALSISWFVCNGVTAEERLKITGEPEVVVIAEYTGRWDKLRSNTSEVFDGQKVMVRDCNDKREYDGLVAYLASHNLVLSLLRYSAQDGAAYYSVHHFWSASHSDQCGIEQV